MTQIHENNLKDRIDRLEKELEKIKWRNQKVEADKAWETSLLRKILVAIITYTIVVIVMYLLKLENIFVSALIPTAWFLLSTLSINIVKTIYIERYIKKRGC